MNKIFITISFIISIFIGFLCGVLFQVRWDSRAISEARRSAGLMDGIDSKMVSITVNGVVKGTSNGVIVVAKDNSSINLKIAPITTINLLSQDSSSLQKISLSQVKNGDKATIVVSVDSSGNVIAKSIIIIH